MKPLVEGLEKQYAGKVEFRRLNVETDQAAISLATQLQLQYVPSFVFVNADGSIASQVVGEQTEEQLKSAVDALK